MKTTPALSKGHAPSTTSTTTAVQGNSVPGNGLPLGPLLALAAAGFVAVLTEALPAAVLPEMARGMSVSASAAGQTLTVYALATALSAVPLMALTVGVDRKRLMQTAVLVVALANAVTALSSSYPLTMIMRAAAGVATAAIWAELVAYARRLAPPRLHGRAIALTMAGVPTALFLGIPLGTFLGELFGWRLTFGSVAVVAAIIAVWLTASVPGHSGQRGGEREPVLGVLRLPGVVPVLLVVAAYVLAHNVLYTYIAPFLDGQGLGGIRESVLLVFGIASALSILVTGALVDRRMRTLAMLGTGLFLLAAVLFTVLAGNSFAVYAAAVLWGLGWGGAPTLLQTAVTTAGGDRGQALLVTAWNGFTAVGAVVGGVFLEGFGAGSFPLIVAALLILVLAVVTGSRDHGFPRRR